MYWLRGLREQLPQQRYYDAKESWHLMSVFDPYIQKIEEYVEALCSKGRQIKLFEANLPINIEHNSNQGVILREDTYVELGNPEAGSSAFILFTDNPTLIKDGRITLIGPDIKESEGKSIPFGQILIVGGTTLNEKEHESLKYASFIGDQIEGYMVRSQTNNIWSRVSKDAAQKGFDFETLGKALISIYKLNNPKIEKMEVIFITSSKEDINQLNEIADQVKKITKEIVKENWKIKGYDIDCVFDCRSCQEKPVCDEIREVLKAKKKHPDSA